MGQEHEACQQAQLGRKSGRRHRRMGSWTSNEPIASSECSDFSANYIAFRNGRLTEGFRTAALCRRAGTGRGAGVRKPRKEETAGRKRRGLAGRDLWGFWGRGRVAHVAAGVEGSRSHRQERTRRAFSGARMRAAGVGAAAGEKSAEVVRTSRSCSGARGEAKAISIARREAPR